MSSYFFDPRYRRFALIWSVSFIGLLAFSCWALTALPNNSVWRWPLAALPIIPSLAAMGIFEYRYLNALDEMQQQLALHALIPGSYFSMSVAVTAFVLEELADMPRLSPMVIFIVFAVVSSVAWLIQNWQHR